MSVVDRIARAIYCNATVEGACAPNDRVSLKIWYPARGSDCETARMTGAVPGDTNAAPYPTIIVLPGINVGPEYYGWFAREMSFRGFVVATYSFVAEEMPGHRALTPGLELAAITPDTYGVTPSATALASVIRTLAAENSSGMLEGMIDTDNIALVGHSAGGSVALYNARPDWFPGVTAAVTYGAHAGASTMLGFAKDTILALPAALPVLLMGGTRDGVIAASGERYGDARVDPLQRLRQTFERGVSRSDDDSYLIEIDGANHFSFAWPSDGATGRPFLDWPETTDSASIRALIVELTQAFLKTKDLASFENHTLISGFQRR